MKLTSVHCALLLFVLGSSSFFILGSSSFAHASYPKPTMSTATVDGNPNEWNLVQDYFAAIYIQGNTGKPQVADAYIRYDYSTQTVHVLVLRASSAYPILVTPSGNAWAEIQANGYSKHVNQTKHYLDTSGNDGTAPDFSWIIQNGKAIGYEASFTLAPGIYNVIIHVAVSPPMTGATGATSGFGKGQASTILDVSIPFVVPFAPFGTITTIISMFAVLAGVAIFRVARARH